MVDDTMAAPCSPWNDNKAPTLFASSRLCPTRGTVDRREAIPCQRAAVMMESRLSPSTASTVERHCYLPFSVYRYLILDSHKSIPVFRRADERACTRLPRSQRFRWWMEATLQPLSISWYPPITHCVTTRSQWHTVTDMQPSMASTENSR